MTGVGYLHSEEGRQRLDSWFGFKALGGDFFLSSNSLKSVFFFQPFGFKIENTLMLLQTNGEGFVQSRMLKPPLVCQILFLQ